MAHDKVTQVSTERQGDKGVFRPVPGPCRLCASQFNRRAASGRTGSSLSRTSVSDVMPKFFASSSSSAVR